jgi:hypothetical protein
MRRWSAVLTAVAVMAVVPTASQAFPWFSSPYTSAAGNCGTSIDPINIVFQGTNAWASDVARNSNVHAGMGDTSGSSQSLSVPYGTGRQCRPMDETRATGPDTRHHSRFWRQPNTDGDAKLVMGDAHYERRTGRYEPGCLGTHAITPVGSTPSGFDIGRRYVVGSFQNGGHYAEGKWWGNTNSFRQCDGGYAWSEGIGVVIHNYHRH